MQTITREIFADEKSRRIFDYRYRYYQSRNMENILDMVIEEYKDFAKRIGTLKSGILDKLRNFSGEFIIYGAGVHARFAMDFLKREEMDDRFAFYIVSEKNSGGVSVKTLDSIKDTGEYLVIIPEGMYAAEMTENLRRYNWDSERFVILPMILLFDMELPDNYDIGGILKNPKNHFIVYGTDWNSILFRSLMRGSEKNFDFSIAELSESTFEDLSYVAGMENVYVVVFNGIRRRKAIEAGVPEEKLISFSNLDELQYFDKDVIATHTKGKKEVFVDGGSMNLYTSGQFLNWCEYECDEIIAFEPDKRCFEICESAIEKMPEMGKKTRLIPKGLWSDDTELSFNEVDNYGSSSFIIHKGEGNEQIIETTSIDNTVGGKEVTFIKMDIEGAELEALKGAKNTIRKYRPTLAISIYHKPEDIVELPMYIKSLVPEYKLYLRNYHLDSTETVLYAI